MLLLAQAEATVLDQLLRMLGCIASRNASRSRSKDATMGPLHWTVDGLQLGTQFVAPYGRPGVRNAPRASLQFSGTGVQVAPRRLMTTDDTP